MRRVYSVLGSNAKDLLLPSNIPRTMRQAIISCVNHGWSRLEVKMYLDTPESWCTLTESYLRKAFEEEYKRVRSMPVYQSSFQTQVQRHVAMIKRVVTAYAPDTRTFMFCWSFDSNTDKFMGGIYKEVMKDNIPLMLSCVCIPRVHTSYHEIQWLPSVMELPRKVHVVRTIVYSNDKPLNGVTILPYASIHDYIGRLLVRRDVNLIAPTLQPFGFFPTPLTLHSSPICQLISQSDNVLEVSPSQRFFQLDAPIRVSMYRSAAETIRMHNTIQPGTRLNVKHLTQRHYSPARRNRFFIVATVEDTNESIHMISNDHLDDTLTNLFDAMNGSDECVLVYTEERWDIQRHRYPVFRVELS